MTEATLEAPSAEVRSRRLGRGLNALLGSTRGEMPEALPQENAGGSAQDQIHVELIERNPFQPRKEFEATALQELTDSIKQHGILQPLLVRSSDGQYQLIAGERRLLAAKKAGLETVPCIVKELDDQSTFEVAIEENLKRKDLSILEKAEAFRDYIERFGSTQDELARKLSVDRSTVSNMLRLLDLSEPVKKALNTEKISAGHARAMIKLSSDDQQELCKRIQTDNLNVRKTEQAVREILKPEAKPAEEPTAEKAEAAAETPANVTPERSNHIQSIETQIREKLGLKVEIKLTSDEAGKVILHFANNDEFERIVNPIKAA